MLTDDAWYVIDNIDSVDSPALAVYPERIESNIRTLLASIDDISRLRPHIKTHKSDEVISLMLKAGITKFKCATIAEAEVLGVAGAPDVMLAYQPVGPKTERFVRLMQQFPNTSFSCLIDNADTAEALSAALTNHNLRAGVFIDLNVGMNRTGITPGEAKSLIETTLAINGIRIAGLHAYDGHLRDADLSVRKEKCDQAFEPVMNLQRFVKDRFGIDLVIVAGGTPTFSIHRNRKDVECSPGTFIYWDKGYSEILTEQEYIFAALVITRVMSKPSADVICVDLGHKAIASENSITKRVSFLNAPHLKPIGHSEEHMVFLVEDGQDYAIGDVLYGVPFHICPTVALHQRPAVVRDHNVATYWETISRNRMITL